MLLHLHYNYSKLVLDITLFSCRCIYFISLFIYCQLWLYSHFIASKFPFYKNLKLTAFVLRYKFISCCRRVKTFIHFKFKSNNRKT